jgi:hypothetical protein
LHIQQNLSDFEVFDTSNLNICRKLLFSLLQGIGAKGANTFGTAKLILSKLNALTY